MAWATTLETAALITVSVRRVTESMYVYYSSSESRRYSSRTITTTVVEYRNMDEATANAAASAMSSDVMDGSHNRTVVTADVARQNDAGAYKIIKTTQVTTAFGAWSDWDPPLS